MTERLHDRLKRVYKEYDDFSDGWRGLRESLERSVMPTSGSLRALAHRLDKIQHEVDSLWEEWSSSINELRSTLHLVEEQRKWKQ